MAVCYQFVDRRVNTKKKYLMIDFIAKCIEVKRQ